MNRRKASHVAAVLIGIVFGLHRLRLGLQGIFVMGDFTYTEFLTLAAFGLTMLPLSFLGIALPRVAGFGLLFSALVAGGGSIFLALTWQQYDASLFQKIEDITGAVAPLVIVGALFIFSNKNWLPQSRR